jgi:LEA14-like dessication related protein
MVVRTMKMSPRRKKILIFLVCFVVILLAFGLYYYNAIHRLRFQLTDVGLGTVGLTSAEIKLTIEVQNPNVLPIYVPSIDFDVYVNNQHLANGYTGAFTVGGSSRQSVTVSVTFAYTDIAMTIVNLITGGGTVTVKAEGSANFFLFGVPFSTTLYDAKFT